MNFINPELEVALHYLGKLTADAIPKWGSMSAQRMVEHLTDSIRMASGEVPQKLEIPEDRIAKSLEYLASEKPMPQNFEASFAPKDTPLRNEEIDLAIDEFVDAWLHFDEVYEKNPEHTEIHPYYGPLNYAQWQRINAKHLTHHFTQFGLVEE